MHILSSLFFKFHIRTKYAFYEKARRNMRRKMVRSVQKYLDSRDDLPWSRINDYLLEVGASQSKDEFIQRAATAVERIIPFDAAAGIFDLERRVLGGPGLSPRWQKAYNDYYRHICPPFSENGGPSYPDPRFFELRFHRYSDYRDSEFYTDFARINSLEHALHAPMPGVAILLVPHRTRWVSAFSEMERAILEILNLHLNNFYSIFNKLTDSEIAGPNLEAIRIRFPDLSERECEIGHLLCRRLTASDIATRLFISVRTVESHIARLYSKLGVRSKREAIGRMTAGDLGHRDELDSAADNSA
jgi:DNA-binding CsgD family transcriptional regulator